MNGWDGLMGKFRTKPFEIEAVHFDGEHFDDVRNFTGERYVDGYAIPNFCRAGTYRRWDDPEIEAEVYDKLHSTWVGVKAHQWIIKGAKGEFYPCDPEIFEAKYEPVYETGMNPDLPVDQFSDHTLVEEDEV